MANDYTIAGEAVAETCFKLTEATRDLLRGWYTVPSEHRWIEASYQDIKFAAEALNELATRINRANTSQEVRQ